MATYSIMRVVKVITFISKKTVTRDPGELLTRTVWRVDNISIRSRRLMLAHCAKMMTQRTIVHRNAIKAIQPCDLDVERITISPESVRNAHRTQWCEVLRIQETPSSLESSRR